MRRCVAGRAAAQDQTVRIIAGFPAGGGIDISARLLVDPFKDALGQPVIVENRVGAAGMIAANAVAKAPPDGRMMLVSTSGEIAISQHLYKEKMTYDPLKDLAPITLIGIVPCVVVVSAATPVHTPQELIAYAKANAGKLSFSSSGVGNPQQLAGELMNMMAGTNVLHVPYRGAAPAVTDVATGDGDHELHQPRRGAGPDAGRQGARGRRHLARPHAATARCRAAAERLAGAQRLRAAQLVRPVHDRRHAGRGGEPLQRDRHQERLAEPKIAETLSAQGIVPRKMSPEQFAAFVALGEQEVRRGDREGQHQAGQLGPGPALAERAPRSAIMAVGGFRSPQRRRRRIAMDAITPKGQQAISADEHSHLVKPAEMEWKPTRFPGCEVKTLLIGPARPA